MTGFSLANVLEALSLLIQKLAYSGKGGQFFKEVTNLLVCLA